MRECGPVRRARLVWAESCGLSLVEVLVAAALVAIVSITLVFAFCTMGSVGKRASDITGADEKLSEDIALDAGGAGDAGAGDAGAEGGAGGAGDAGAGGAAHRTTEDGEISFDVGGETVALPSLFTTYTTEDGRSLSTFKYKSAADGAGGGD
jgi:hypothetical protein